MAEQDIFERLSDLDPYDREERCRKAIRTIGKAIIMRIAAGVLLLVALIRGGTAPVAIGLSVFALVIILVGVFPLAGELKKQCSLLKTCLMEQEEVERKPGAE